MIIESNEIIKDTPTEANRSISKNNFIEHHENAIFDEVLNIQESHTCIYRNEWVFFFIYLLVEYFLSFFEIFFNGEISNKADSLVRDWTSSDGVIIILLFWYSGHFRRFDILVDIRTFYGNSDVSVLWSITVNTIFTKHRLHKSNCHWLTSSRRFPVYLLWLFDMCKNRAITGTNDSFFSFDSCNFVTRYGYCIVGIIVFINSFGQLNIYDKRIWFGYSKSFFIFEISKTPLEFSFRMPKLL